jgi:hypothetical protein
MKHPGRPAGRGRTDGRGLRPPPPNLLIPTSPPPPTLRPACSARGVYRGRPFPRTRTSRLPCQGEGQSPQTPSCPASLDRPPATKLARAHSFHHTTPLHKPAPAPPAPPARGPARSRPPACRLHPPTGRAPGAPTGAVARAQAARHGSESRAPRHAAAVARIRAWDGAIATSPPAPDPPVARPWADGRADPGAGGRAVRRAC